MNIWQYPGPERFLSDVADSLVDGQSVILQAPPLTPADFRDELRALLGMDGWSLRTLTGDNANPAREVLEVHGVMDRLTNEVGAATLLEEDSLSGCVVWCQPAEHASAQRWVDFLDAYALAHRARPNANGPRFVLCLAADFTNIQLPKKTGVTVYDLGDAVGQTDQLLLAHRHTGSARGMSIEAHVIANTAASVALWDTELLFRLLDESPERLFNPIDVLREYAVDREWSKAVLPTWCSGAKRKWGSEEEIHSAYLALDDPKGIVSSRVWAGQAAVLLPAIEKRRIALIENQRSLLQRELPFKTDYDEVTDVFDLEIGPVWYLLKKRNAPTTAITNALRLKKARDSLAHMNPLSVEDAFWI